MKLIHNWPHCVICNACTAVKLFLCTVYLLFIYLHNKLNKYENKFFQTKLQQLQYHDQIALTAFNITRTPEHGRP